MSIIAALQTRLDVRQNREAGFTLVELLVVVIIIGILAAIATPVYLGVQKNAKEATTKSDVANGAIAVTTYVADNGGVVPASVTDDAVGAVPAAGTIAAATLNRFGWSKSVPSTSAIVYATSGSGTSTRWCITGTSSTGATYRISSSTLLTKGTCAALGAVNY